MKIVLVNILFVLLLNGDWLTNLDLGKKQAAIEHKLILLNFSGSDWCGPCIKMKREVFETEAFRNYASNNLILVRADFPRLKKNQLEKAQQAHNESLAEKYNPNGRFPLTLLLDADGNVIREWDGYKNQSPEAFVAEVKKASGK